MALKAVVATLGEVPEPHRQFYVADGDRFVLDIDPLEHPAVLPLKNASDRVAAKNAEWRAQIEKIEALPVDFSIREWNRLRAVEAELTGAADVERARAEGAEQLHALDLKIASNVRIINRIVIEGALREALIAAHVAPQFVKACIAMLAKECAVTEPDGEPVAVHRLGHGRVGDLASFVRRWAKSQNAQPFLDKKQRQPDDGGSFAALIRNLK
jgi:hypothetical protein